MKQLIYIGVALVLVVTGYFAFQGYLSRSQKAPGLIDGRLAPCGPKPNAVCSDNFTNREHYIKPIALRVSSLSAVTAGVERSGGKIITVDQDYLAAEFSSSVFGFVDDLELLRDANAGVIHVRSSSRVGYSDLGVNRKRVEALRKLLENGQ
ncbi:MAG: DUF1499 domain-containing protein [Oceanospirillales bacterium]|nr:DUF1499 domain-containing protein [Oceanospirillales bacterium]MBR9887754.1 DUF1499 domain-containing protein [Oceanospirillales bacterium]